jgi:hypothetical protein
MSEKPMDKMREEFERHCIEKEGCPSSELTNDLRVGFYAGYQAATAEVELNFKNICKRLSEVRCWVSINTYQHALDEAKQALQKGLTNENR